MSSEKHTTIFRKDYRVPEYLVEHIDLTFKLYDSLTQVTARAVYTANQQSTDFSGHLVLNGEKLELVEIRMDGRTLSAEEYQVNEKDLRLIPGKDRFELEIVTRIDPVANASLEGLYCSSGNFCTQCEAEGFRKITYYQDRPDVLSRFTTRIEGDLERCPVMLSNGNLLESGILQDGRHFAVWHDPFPKPCYLFALVAGKLAFIEDTFVTRSGRNITLRIYVEEHNKEKCGHAMRSLQKAMKWDEDVYGLEYDLDIFMIVAVEDFNMGAMENKGLNIFNAKYILASPETATDLDYMGIEGVVAHEYFHNWTGNRVTCRDWFQLSLKEGLTVFRDQEFSADMNSRAVQRIDDVQLLKNHQFREDAGPMAHPVRPDSFVEINNFYTMTVYNKGAEVIRMMHTLLGASGFRKGMDLYFARHDGQAVTCDDFVAAMADASGKDLGQFSRWYSQSGSPLLKVHEEWSAAENIYSVRVNQSCPETPGQRTKEPFHIPLAIGLLDKNGNDLLVSEEKGTQVLELRQPEETYTFRNIGEKPVLSFLRNFSAPVQVKSFQSREELAFLLAHDSDLFNRWNAASQLSESIILETVQALQRGKVPSLDSCFIEAIGSNLRKTAGDKALLALAMQLPAETYLAMQMDVIDPVMLHHGREFVRSELSKIFSREFHSLYEENKESGKYQISQEAMGKRALKNMALSYLMAGETTSDEYLTLCVNQYYCRANMTDTIAALSSINNLAVTQREEILEDFYTTWKHDPLVIDKWFTMQAVSSLEGTLEKVMQLMHNPSFSIKNPNKVRALIGAFGVGNHFRFHDISGSGYAFLADRILELDSFNPQIAARLVSPLTTWKRYDQQRQNLMCAQLKRILAADSISGEVFEIVKKSL